MNLVLDIARGIAALGVFLFHISDGLRESMPAIASIFRFGSLGVPLFFVISGYVISASADAIIRKNESANAFLKRRFLRIYPPFWCSILVVLALPYLIAAISMLKSGVYEAPLPQFQVLTGGEWLQLISLTRFSWPTTATCKASSAKSIRCIGRWPSSSSFTCWSIWRCSSAAISC